MYQSEFNVFFESPRSHHKNFWAENSFRSDSISSSTREGGEVASLFISEADFFCIMFSSPLGYDKLLNSIYIIFDLHYTDIVLCHCHAVACFLFKTGFAFFSPREDGKRKNFGRLVGRFFSEMFNACEKRSGKHYKILKFQQKRQKARSVKLSTHYAKPRLSNIFSLRIVLYGLWPAWPEIRLRCEVWEIYFRKKKVWFIEHLKWFLKI